DSFNRDQKTSRNRTDHGSTVEFAVRSRQQHSSEFERNSQDPSSPRPVFGRTGGVKGLKGCNRYNGAGKVRDREGAIANTRGACAPQSEKVICARRAKFEPDWRYTRYPKVFAKGKPSQQLHALDESKQSTLGKR